MLVLVLNFPVLQYHFNMLLLILMSKYIGFAYMLHHPHKFVWNWHATWLFHSGQNLWNRSSVAMAIFNMVLCRRMKQSVYWRYGYVLQHTRRWGNSSSSLCILQLAYWLKIWNLRYLRWRMADGKSCLYKQPPRLTLKFSGTSPTFYWT